MAACGYAGIAVVAIEALLAAWGPMRIPGALSYVDVLTVAFLALCGVTGLSWIRRRDAPRPAADRALAEVLIVVGLVLYLFGYIYAANANMDYVQRFAASGGNVRLSPDTRTERLVVSVRYLPGIAVGLWAWLRALRGAGPSRAEALDLVEMLGLPLCLLSSVAMAFSHPSVLSPSGAGPLAFVAYVPLFVVLSVVSYRRGVFYGTAAWTIQTMLTNYWLGTYSLVSLQLVTVLLALEGAAFFSLALALYRLVRRCVPRAAFVVFPLAWTCFDYLRTVGFAGYPWILVGATQYAFVPLIQIAALTGVWGVGLVVLLVDSALAAALAQSDLSRASRLAIPCGAAAALVACVAGGAVVLARQRPAPEATARLALVQQNNDPRKNDYDATFDTLRRLTDATLASRPDLVVWSETAFVPNIRRWSALDPAEYPLAALVRELLAYQKSLGTWLLTGNDDYEMRVEAGQEVRLDFNAAILFSDRGERVETYHKVRLVPFTESFPWKKQLPGFHRLLLSFDVYLWEPGAERVVFEHPRFRFCTPICFEDAFPDHVRRFVLSGLDFILSISNDYWSLTEVEAFQHAANAVFRAVENRRPLVRATASGLTVEVDAFGRQLGSIPCYTEGSLVVDVPLRGHPTTLYTAWGDWFPAAAFLSLLGIVGAALVSPAGRARRGGPRIAVDRGSRGL